MHWDAVSPDLTTGCTGTAPNGARGCFISAIGVADGGDAVYTGSDDGKVFVNAHAVSAEDPTPRLDRHHGEQPAEPAGLAVRGRPVELAHRLHVVRRVQRGHAGQLRPRLQDRRTAARPGPTSPNGLPDSPVNSIVIDPAFPDTLYAGTDIGPYVTHQRRRLVGPAGHRLPEGVRLAARLRLAAPGARRRAPTAGRRTSIGDSAQAPALIVSKDDAGKPVGPGHRPRLHDHGSQHRQRRRDRGQHHRPGPGPHGVRVGLGRRHRGRRDRDLVRADRPGRRQRRCAPSPCTSTRRWTRRSPRSSTTASSCRRNGGFGTTGSPHTTAISPAYACAGVTGRPRPVAPGSASRRATT